MISSAETDGLRGWISSARKIRKGSKSIYDMFKQLILGHDEFLEEDLSLQGYALLVELNRIAKPSEYPLALYMALNLKLHQPGGIGSVEQIVFILRSFSLKPVTHFSVGTTIPRMITFWHSTNMMNVGMAAITSEA